MCGRNALGTSNLIRQVSPVNAAVLIVSGGQARNNLREGKVRGCAGTCQRCHQCRSADEDENSESSQRTESEKSEETATMTKTVEQTVTQI